MLDANAVEGCQPGVALGNHHLSVVAQRSSGTQEPVVAARWFAAYSPGACFVFAAAYDFVVEDVAG